MPEKQDSQLDDIDRKIVALTQEGLPLISNPYQPIAEEVGIEAQEVRARMQAMLERGVIRRIGAVPNHYALGMRANGMSVWDVEDSRVSELGRQVGGLDFVSHCYCRPRHLPIWPFNLFAMVHGDAREQVEEKVHQIALLLGEHCAAHDILYSTKILKKTGLRIAA